MNKFLTLHQVERALRVSISTVKRALRQDINRLPSFKIGSRIRVSENDLLNWVKGKYSTTVTAKYMDTPAGAPEPGEENLFTIAAKKKEKPKEQPNEKPKEKPCEEAKEEDCKLSRRRLCIELPNDIIGKIVYGRMRKKGFSEFLNKKIIEFVNEYEKSQDFVLPSQPIRGIKQRELPKKWKAELALKCTEAYDKADFISNKLLKEFLRCGERTLREWVAKGIFTGYNTSRGMRFEKAKLIDDLKLLLDICNMEEAKD